MKKYIKSPMNYLGGKYKIIKEIDEELPGDIDTFVDLFAGGFTVGVNVVAERVVCNDRLEYMIDLYRSLGSRDIEGILEYIDSKIREYGLSRDNAEGYYKFREYCNKEEGDILDLVVVLSYAYNNMIRYNSEGKLNIPFGKRRFNKNLRKNLIEFVEELKRKEIEYISKDFREVDLGDLTEKSVVYCDPPYLATSVHYTSPKYAYKGWDEEDERDLLELLDKLDRRGIKFALSNVTEHKGVRNEILEEWSKKYKVKYIDNDYNNCNARLRDRESKTVEVLVTNYTK